MKDGAGQPVAFGTAPSNPFSRLIGSGEDRLLAPLRGCQQPHRPNHCRAQRPRGEARTGDRLSRRRGVALCAKAAALGICELLGLPLADRRKFTA